MLKIIIMLSLLNGLVFAKTEEIYKVGFLTSIKGKFAYKNYIQYKNDDLKASSMGLQYFWVINPNEYKKYTSKGPNEFERMDKGLEYYQKLIKDYSKYKDFDDSKYIGQEYVIIEKKQLMSYNMGKKQVIFSVHGKFLLNEGHSKYDGTVFDMNDEYVYNTGVKNPYITMDRKKASNIFSKPVNQIAVYTVEYLGMAGTFPYVRIKNIRVYNAETQKYILGIKTEQSKEFTPY